MPELKKDARDIILEFIRSRPPLKKSSQRKLKPRNIKLNLHDQLMISIQTYSKPLRKVPEKKKTAVDSETGSVEKTNTKRLLKVDKKLLNTFSSSDDVSLNNFDFNINPLRCLFKNIGKSILGSHLGGQI